MSVDSDVVIAFFNLARDEFSYLEEEFGFTFVNQSVVHGEYFPDTTVDLTYVKRDVGVLISWYFAGATISVGLVEAPGGVFPERVHYNANTHPQGVSLHGLVEASDPTAMQDFVLKGDPTSLREIKRRARQINTDMRGVLGNVAAMLRKHALDVLQGDSSRFPEVYRH